MFSALFLVLLVLAFRLLRLANLVDGDLKHLNFTFDVQQTVLIIILRWGLHLCQYLSSNGRYAGLEARSLCSIRSCRLVLIIDCGGALTTHVRQTRETRCTFGFAILCKHASLISSLMCETKDTFLLRSRLRDATLTPCQRRFPVSIDSFGRCTHFAKTEACLCTTGHRWSEAETLTLVHDADRVTSGLQLAPFSHRKAHRVRSLTCLMFRVLSHVRAPSDCHGLLNLGCLGQDGILASSEERPNLAL